MTDHRLRLSGFENDLVRAMVLVAETEVALVLELASVLVPVVEMAVASDHVEETLGYVLAETVSFGQGTTWVFGVAKVQVVSSTFRLALLAQDNAAKD